MMLTRATDNRLKAFFAGGEVRYGEGAFQGKGFRSLGQEAIYACGIRLRRGEPYLTSDGWRGDVVAPLIRDLGVALAMKPDGETVRMVLSAQMAKAGPPMDGKDLHIGDLAHGHPAGRRAARDQHADRRGMAMAFAQEGERPRGLIVHRRRGVVAGRVARGDQPVRRAQAAGVFCVQNNQTALSTPVAEQSAVRVFADKAAGYGIPGITIDGTDADEIAAAFAWAVERARAGKGADAHRAGRACGCAATPITTTCSTSGKDAAGGWDYPPLTEQGYAEPRSCYAYWAARDPIATYAARLEADGVLAAGRRGRLQARGRRARRRPGARGHRCALARAGRGRGRRVRRGARARAPRSARCGRRGARSTTIRACPRSRAAPPSTARGHTFLEAVMLGVQDALRGDPRAFVFGEDVGGKYGNAFLLLRPLLAEFGDRIINSPLAEERRPRCLHRRGAGRAADRSARSSSTTSWRPASISS